MVGVSGFLKGAQGFPVPFATLADNVAWSPAAGAAGGGLVQPSVFAGVAEAAVTVLAGSGRPVSPALRCVTALVIAFFCTYLGVVFLRFLRSCLGGGESQRAKDDGRLAQSLEAAQLALVESMQALRPVPMFCILATSARLRGLQLDPLAGDPQRWVQLCMYGGTAVLLFRLALEFATSRAPTAHEQAAAPSFGEPALPPPLPPPPPSRMMCFMRVTAPCLLFVISTAIAAGLLVMPSARRGGSAAATPPLPLTLQCVVALALVYFAEYALVASTEALAQRWTRRQSAAVSSSMAALREDASTLGVAGLLARQVFPMLCVLLLGIALHSQRHELAVPSWAKVAMLTSTGMATAQVLWGATAVALRFTRLQLKESDAGDEADGERSRQSESGGVLVSFARWTILVGLYAGVATTLAGVFAMEVTHHAAPGEPPLSAGMWCVMTLVVLYFCTHFVLVAAEAAPAVRRKWLGATSDALQRSLAFAPMLGVMMLGVRLRAMQLGSRDPQPWACTAMFAATASVVIMVLCNLTPGCDGCLEGDDYSGDFVEASIPKKLFFVVLVAARLAASAVLYVMVAVLIVALFVMELENDLEQR